MMFFFLLYTFSPLKTTKKYKVKEKDKNKNGANDFSVCFSDFILVKLFLIWVLILKKNLLFASISEKVPEDEPLHSFTTATVTLNLFEVVHICGCFQIIFLCQFILFVVSGFIFLCGTFAYFC